MNLNILTKREKEVFGSRIEPGGDMYKNHLEFIEWAKAYDDGDLDMIKEYWPELLPYVDDCEGTFVDYNNCF